MNRSKSKVSVPFYSLYRARLLLLLVLLPTAGTVIAQTATYPNQLIRMIVAFSTTIGTPSDWRICSASSRAVRSVPPPAGNATIIRMCWLG